MPDGPVDVLPAVGVSASLSAVGVPGALSAADVPGALSAVGAVPPLSDLAGALQAAVGADCLPVGAAARLPDVAADLSSGYLAPDVPHAHLPVRGDPVSYGAWMSDANARVSVRSRGGTGADWLGRKDQANPIEWSARPATGRALQSLSC